MPSTFRSPRSLAAWLELDYFHRRRLFRGWWGGSLVVALVVAVAAFGVLLAVSGRGAFQAGPLSAPHALFQDRCELCHQDNGATGTHLWRGDGVGSVPDSACTACHAGSHHNPPHAGEMGTCVSCHHEHRGHAALVRVPDSKCTACHENLRREDGSSSPFAERAVRFDDKGGHPPIRDREDSGTLKFNHAVHLAKQGVLVQHDPQKFEKLECVSCHEQDAAGKYMKPISYDAHCKKCHPISVQVGGAWSDLTLTGAANAFPALPIRHPGKAESPAAVRPDVRDRLARLIQSPLGPRLLDALRRKPAPRFPYPAESAPLAEKEFAWVSHQLVESEGILFGERGDCAYCHTVKHSAKNRPDGLPVLSPSNVRERWWDHAKFAHDAHRMLDCQECHAAKNSTKTADVLLPGIDLCLRCHDARATPAARSDCIECHAYHYPALQRKARERGTRKLEDVLRR